MQTRGPSLILNAHIQLGMAPQSAYKPSAGRGGKQESHGASWSAGLAEIVSSRFREKPCLKGLCRKVIE